jgi:DNA invertase Pin-like site-specific DNA recombinase
MASVIGLAAGVLVAGMRAENTVLGCASRGARDGQNLYVFSMRRAAHGTSRKSTPRRTAREGGFVHGDGAAARPARVGLYARVSTHDQQTLPMQIAAMRAHAKRRGWAIVAQIKDVGSGARARPLRDAILTAARRRELDVVLVWKLDRWGRSLPDLVVTLRELDELGVGFVSLTEALDFTTPTGRAMVGLLAVFAEFERDLLRERVKAGMAQARTKGHRIGRPPTPERLRTQVRRMFVAEKMSKAEIARRLAISRPTVRRLLARRPKKE